MNEDAIADMVDVIAVLVNRLGGSIQISEAELEALNGQSPRIMTEDTDDGGMHVYILPDYVAIEEKEEPLGTSPLTDEIQRIVKNKWGEYEYTYDPIGKVTSTIMTPDGLDFTVQFKDV